MAVRKILHVGTVSMSCLWIVPHEHFWYTAYDDFIVQLKTFDEIMNVFRSYLKQFLVKLQISKDCMSLSKCFVELMLYMAVRKNSDL